MQNDCAKRGSAVPIQQPHHRYLPQDAIAMLKDIISDSNYGYYVICCKGNNDPLKRLVSCRGDKLLDFARGMHTSGYLNYYITKNPSWHGTWKTEDIASLQHVVIDIDCHQEDITAENLRPILADAMRHLTESLFLDQAVPYPNYVVYTGRGLHLWWIFTPNKPTDCYRAKYHRIVTSWIKLITQSLAQYKSPCSLAVDSGASVKDMGLMRLPGSINPKTNSVVEIQRYYTGRYDLHREYDNLPDDGHKSARYAQTAGADSNLTALATWRMDFIARLRDYRNAPEGEENRNDMNLQVYCAARMIYGSEKAYDMLERFNAGFKCPMTERIEQCNLYSTQKSRSQ